MLSPGRLPFGGDRWTAFVRTLQLEGVDLTGATFAMQLRLLPDTPGSPLVSLGTVTSASSEGVRLIYGGTATVAAHITAGRIETAPDGMVDADNLELSLIGIRINESTMEGLPATGEVGDDTPISWDIHITPVGGIKQRWLFGPFTVRAGVTQ
jgi:hypothetical protein